MRSHTLVALFSSLVLASSLHAAVAGNRPTGWRTVAIQGVTCPEISMWTGGDPSGAVVVEKAAPGASARKHLGAVRYEPIVMRASPPFSQPLLDCVADLCANRAQPVTLLLSAFNHNGTPTGDVIQALDAVLSEVQFPSIGAAVGKDVVVVTLVFQTTRTEVVATGTASNPASAFSNNPKRATAGNFRVTLAGLDTIGVAGVDAFTIKRANVDSATGVGGDRFKVGLPASTVFSDLTLNLNAPAPADWVAWRDSFILKGGNEVWEKSGAIELLSADLKTVIFSLQFNNAGIMRLAEVPDAARAPESIQALLYVETMSVANGPAAVPMTKSASTTPSTSESTPATRKSPAEAQAAPAEAAAAESTATAVTSPEDQGARDPADFPRPEGTVRTAFTSIRQKSSLQESAKYTANQTAAQVMEFYEKELGGSGWVEGKRNENNFAARGAHQIQATWTKDNRTANLTLIDLAPGSSELQILVQSRL
jgi:hypothetical protein